NFVREDIEEAIVVETEVDLEEYPLDDITNYDQYTDINPPEKAMKKRERQRRLSGRAVWKRTIKLRKLH
ncbi:hypothetical protein J3Q64DRAFT_1639062, partial [Phycomyces blakesleeanus]